VGPGPGPELEPEEWLDAFEIGDVACFAGETGGIFGKLRDRDES